MPKQRHGLAKKGHGNTVIVSVFIYKVVFYYLLAMLDYSYLQFRPRFLEVNRFLRVKYFAFLCINGAPVPLQWFYSFKYIQSFKYKTPVPDKTIIFIVFCLLSEMKPFGSISTGYR